jgi:hypothetical protein
MKNEAASLPRFQQQLTNRDALCRNELTLPCWRKLAHLSDATLSLWHPLPIKF